MADNPGQPLNPSQLAGAQGISTSGFTIPNHTLRPGTGAYNLEQYAPFTFPVDKANYRASSVPLQPLRADYSNP